MHNSSGAGSSQQPTYLDFELEIRAGIGREYPVKVIDSPAGEALETMRFPFDELALESCLKDLQIALLRSGGERRKVLSSEEKAVQDFGRSLFDSLLTGEVRSRYDVSQREARRQGKGLRLKLRVHPPELATLPWEFLYDQRQAEYMCLSRNTPVIRYLELPEPVQPLTVTPPLRILGMIASPADQPQLEVEREKRRVERALQTLRDNAVAELIWLEGQTWRDLQQQMRQGPWHIFHFIGHGGFDRNIDEGFVALADRDGETRRLGATQLARLLHGHNPLRLVVLNSCEGARGSKLDTLSSTAAMLVRRGIPAVLAMQYQITDRAAVEFARSFYEALADRMPVDASVVEARIAVSLAVPNTVEWGVPVLYMRSIDSMLFNITPSAEQPATEEKEPPPAPILEPTPPPVKTVQKRLKADIGVQTLGGVSTPILERGTDLPAETSQTFSTATDGQSQVEVQLTYGDRPMAVDNVSLGEFVIDGIPPAPRGVPQIDVQVRVDENLQLSVTATERASGCSRSLGIVDLSGINPPSTGRRIPDEPDESQQSSSAEDLRIEDIFKSFFGEAGKQRRTPRPGADVTYTLDVTLEEAVLGCERRIDFRRSETCSRCHGSGSEPGTNPICCPQCQGTGEVRRKQQTSLGSFVQVTECPDCKGEGEIATSPCKLCQGQRLVEVDRQLLVKVPAGVNDGTRIRLSGQGNSGTGGSPAGDLYLRVRVKEHPFFVRKGLDLHLTLPVTDRFAKSGGKIRIPQFEKSGFSLLKRTGKFFVHKLDPGTQHGQILRFTGKGVRALKGEDRGDLVLTIETYDPQRMPLHIKGRLEAVMNALDGHDIQIG